MKIYTLIDSKNNEVLIFTNYILAAIEASDREDSKLYMSDLFSGEVLYPAKELKVEYLNPSFKIN